ncbi:hypothetical protein PIROE2DRAFT_2226 [Piromyces sp. E2]|nr:hypothetical protein PIROE2DRAFT_2226 [Piromyces sp. E2]|eukprot:OUM69800.1 hypothetical protein PIROE2DRAFT_2226 [Piromyces sp. E2]
MKFITPFFALVAATVVLAFPQNEQNATTGDSCNPEFDNYLDECIKLNCSDTAEVTEVCSTFKSDKCQQFYNTFTTEVDKCYSHQDPTIANLIKVSGKNHKKTMDSVCSEENEKCPFFQKEYKGKRDQSINDTCKSKKCIKATVEALESISNSTSTEISKGLIALINKVIDKPYNSSDSTGYNSISYMIHFLKSEYCTAQSSAITTVKYSMVAILLTIAYILF